MDAFSDAEFETKLAAPIKELAMQVSQMKSPTLGLRFGNIFSDSPTQLITFRSLKTKGVGVLFDQQKHKKLAQSTSFPNSTSFALLSSICHNLSHKANNRSKKDLRMTQLMTLEQAANKLAVSKRSMQRWVSQGRIETIRLSPGVVRVSEKSLERFINNQQRQQRLGLGAKRG